jgi:hypothetical protein
MTFVLMVMLSVLPHTKEAMELALTVLHLWVTGQRRLLMTDDIVTRLQEEYDRLFSEFQIVAPIHLDAIDEIERLRGACDYYHKMCSTIADKNFTANEEIHRLKLILTHICDVWGSDLLSIIDEMNRFKKEVV